MAKNFSVPVTMVQFWPLKLVTGHWYWALNMLELLQKKLNDLQEKLLNLRGYL